MEELLLNIFFWGVFVGGGTIFLIFCTIMGIQQYKRNMENQKAYKKNKEVAPAEQEYSNVTIKVTVVDQICCVKTIGIKTPETVKEFSIVFQTQKDEILKMNVPEEMYDGFEKGQTGVLTLTEGQVYGFELTETED